MYMKWIWLVSIVIIAGCAAKGDKKNAVGKVAQSYCECIYADTTKWINTDSCFKASVAVNAADVKQAGLDSNFSGMMDGDMEEAGVDLAVELERMCPGWSLLELRRNEKLQQAAIQLAKQKDYLPAGDNIFSGKVLTWQLLPKGEKEYEIKMMAKDGVTTRTFITQIPPSPAVESAAIIHITFEKNEAAFHEKYEYRAVHLNLLSNK
jgi:hypothetical protein